MGLSGAKPKDALNMIDVSFVQSADQNSEGKHRDREGCPWLVCVFSVSAPSVQQCAETCCTMSPYVSVKAAVNGLFICVCPEYLMALADFFVKGAPQTQAAPVSTQAAVSAAGLFTHPGCAGYLLVDSVPIVIRFSSETLEVFGGTGSAAATVQAKKPPPPPKGDMRIHFTLDHPEIVILENSMDINTNALFMKVQPPRRFILSPRSTLSSY